MAKVHFVNSKVLQAGDGVGGEDLSQYATIAYSDAEDAKIRSDLDEVQSEGRTNTYEVQPTMNSASIGQCVFSNPGGQYTNQGSIQFSATDLSGHSIHWALIKPGNSFVITELNSDDYAVGEVRSVNNTTNTVQVRIFEGEGSPLQGDILHFGGSPYAARNDEENNYLTEEEGDAKYAPVGHVHDYAPFNHDHSPRYMGHFDKPMTSTASFGSLGSGRFAFGQEDKSSGTLNVDDVRYIKAYGSGFPSTYAKKYTGGGIIVVYSASGNAFRAAFQIIGGPQALDGDTTFKVLPMAKNTNSIGSMLSYRFVVTGAWWEDRLSAPAPASASTEQQLRDELYGTDPAKIEEIVADWEALYEEEANYVN